MYDCKVLVFARTSTEARELSYPIIFKHVHCSSEAISIVHLKHSEWLRNEAVYDIPHVIEHPKKTCKCCGSWWKSEIGADNMCDECRREFQYGYIGD